MLESAIEKPCVAYAKKHGVKVKKKVFGEQLDRTFYLGFGRIFIVEFKAPGKKLTPLQEEEINELLKLGCDVEVHDDVQEFKTAFDRRLNSDPSIKVGPQKIHDRFSSLAARTCCGGHIRRPRNFKNRHYPSGV